MTKIKRAWDPFPLFERTGTPETAGTLNRFSVSAARFFELPPVESKHHRKFLKAADIQSRNPNISENALANSVVIDRKTLRGWRKMKHFVNRIELTRRLDAQSKEMAKNAESRKLPTKLDRDRHMLLLEIAENLQRPEITAQKRDELITRWAELKAAGTRG